MFRIIVAVACICIVPGTNAQELRIAGGNYAEEGEIPYIALILANYPDSTIYCGGSIITEEYILSAARCFDTNYSFLIYLVRVGSLERRSGGSEHAVDNVINHPYYKLKLNNNFTVEDIYNDISLIRVKPHIKFTVTVKAIDIWSSNIETGIKVKASGWGQTEENGFVSKFLRYDYYNIADPKICGSDCEFFNETQNLCTISNKGTGTCRGDSGGPLVYKNYLIGVVSTASLECGNGFATYTKVSHYIEWIETVILDTK